MRILLVEDDRRTAAFVAKGLRESGFIVRGVATADEARTAIAHETYDAIVLDRLLPDGDSLDLIRSARAAGNRTPILVLSARGAVDDRVQGLRAGADDYLAKPFAFTELLWRVHALIRRTSSQAAATRLTAGDLEIDLLTRRVRRAGRRIELQPREFALLEYLVRNAGRIVTRTMIIEHVWEYDFDPQSNIVDSRLSRLRAKIDGPGEAPLIRTVRGVGYLLGGDD